MFRVWLIGLVLLAATGCGAPDPQVTVAEEPKPTAEVMASVIRANERFNEPIVLEIWGNAKGPTTEALVAAGYLLREPGQHLLARTDEGRRLGVKESNFQSNIPVFHVPVGRRELVDVVPIGNAELENVVEVEFTYRNAPSALGAELVAGGSRGGELDGESLRRGRAILGLINDDWRISTLQL